MHDALRKAGTRVLLHIPVSRVRSAEFTDRAESSDERQADPLSLLAGRLATAAAFGLLICSADEAVFTITGISYD
jgi:hypothetical protein